MIRGAQCVMMVSVPLMLELLADNLAILLTIDMEVFQFLGIRINFYSKELSHADSSTIVCLIVYSVSQGTGRIWLDNVNCNGNNTRLSECSHRGWGVLLSCSHYEDVALQCLNTTIAPISSE